MIEVIKQSDDLAVAKAKSVILDGGVICFRSDTVYAFACDSSSDKGVERLYELKNRPIKKAVAIYVDDIGVAKNIFEFNDYLSQVCDKYLPGYVTVVAKTKENSEFNISKKLNLESKFLGFRIVDNKFVNKLTYCLNAPLAVTSANLSDHEELLSGDEILGVFADSAADFLLIDGGVCESGGVSTVIKVDGEKLELLREGIVPFD